MKKLLLAIVMLLVSAASFAVVNVNTATQAELESLQGIGPVKAKAIIDGRIKNGPFKTVDDLDRVKGIGKATIDKLRKDISVSGATTIPAAPGVAKKDAAKVAAPATAPAPERAPAKAATPAAAPAPAKADAGKAAAPAAAPSKAEIAKEKAAAKAARKEQATKVKAEKAAAKEAKKEQAARDKAAKEAAKKDAPKK